MSWPDEAAVTPAIVRPHPPQPPPHSTTNFPYPNLLHQSLDMTQQSLSFLPEHQWKPHNSPRAPFQPLPKPLDQTAPPPHPFPSPPFSFPHPSSHIPPAPDPLQTAEKVHPLSPIEVSPPKKKRKTFALSDVINVDDDSELELLAQHNAANTYPQPRPKPCSAVDPMAPAFAQPNRVFIGRGGGMFKTLDENTLEIVDSDDEDFLTTQNLIINDDNGMSVVQPSIPTPTSIAPDAHVNLPPIPFPNGPLTPVTMDTANTPGVTYSNSNLHPVPLHTDAFHSDPSLAPKLIPLQNDQEVTPTNNSDSLTLMNDPPVGPPDDHLSLLAAHDTDIIPLDEITMPFMPSSVTMMPADPLASAPPLFQHPHEFQPPAFNSTSAPPLDISQPTPSNNDEVVQVTPRQTSVPVAGGAMSQEGLRTLLKQNSLSADATEEAASPEQLTVQLMPHQRRGLAWMTKREKPLYPDEDVVATDDECLGGILADDQGLGKTLTMIALMVSSPPEVSSDRVDVSTDSEKHSASNDFVEDAVKKTSSNLPWRTLIICPLSLISQWKEEIRSRIRKGHRPSICVYHGPRRERNVKALRKYDIVITTYATLANEYPKILKDHPEFEMRKSQKLQLPRRKPGPLFQVSWYRVVLDEAQYVKNRSTDCWGAVMALNSERRWCLSGTPIQNNVDDLYSLFCFIRYRCVPDYETWNVRWKKPLESSRPKLRERTFKRFQTIVGVVLLRRTKKDTIDGKPLICLPERKASVYDSKFYDHEEEVMYRAVQMKTVVTVNKFLVDGTLAMNYSSVLLLLLRLRQACSHPFLIQYARMQGCRDGTISEANDKYSTPYSEEDLEEALELVSGGHSLLEMLDENVRERISKMLEPALKDQPKAEAFGCMRCQESVAWKHGWTIICGHMFCETCLKSLREERRCSCCDFNMGDTDDLEVLVSTEDLRKEIHARIVVGSKGHIEAISASEFRKLVNEELSTRQSENREMKKAAASNAAKENARAKTAKQESDVKAKIETSRVPTTGVEVKAEPESAGAGLQVSQPVRAADMKNENIIGSDVTPERQDPMETCEVKTEGNNVKAEALEAVSDDDSLSEIPIGQWKRRGESSEAYSSSDEPIARLPRKKASGNTEREVRGKGKNLSATQKRRQKRKAVRKRSKESSMASKTKDEAAVGMPEDQKRKLLDAFSQPSTKIRIILDELNRIREEDETEKTLIFSQWTSMLDIIQFHIRVNGHQTCRLDGSMTLLMRQQQIEEFKESKLKNVFLISLHAGGTGLNLTVASRVILADVWWNPAVEEQAIDRVHRIGQTRDVNVCRLKMTGTVEERIYSICDRKRELVDGALGVTGAQSLGRQKLSMQELIYLFGGAAEEVARTAQEGTDAALAASNILNLAGSYSLHG